jgi:hypothetical protein
MTTPTAAAIAVPLRLRPPNPPEPFVGRAVERARLHKTLQRGPVGLVWGFSGVGKSSLVRAVVADDDAATTGVGRWLVVDAGAGRCPVVLLLHTLAQIPGVRLDIDAATLPDAGAPADGNADDGLADVAVTALEEHGLRVFIDDVVRVADAPRLVALVALARRFARQARVVVVCREDPRDPALLAHTVAVGPLPDDDVVALLQDAQPTLSPPEARALARRARGSPWRALQLTLGDDDGGDDDHGPERSLLSLSPAAQGLLRTLALVPAAIPRTTLARATRLPAADVLDSLARRGWLEVHADAVRLHSAARPVVTAVVHADADERRLRGHRLLTALVDADDPDVDLALAAVALIDDAGDSDALLRLLDRHGDALRHAGHAPLLWNTVRRLAGPTPSAAIAAWAAALAADVGDDAIAALGGAPNARRPVLLDWQRTAIDARALHDRDRTRDALTLLRAQPPTTATVEDADALLVRGDLAVVVADLDDAEDAFARAAQAPSARARLHARVGLLEVQLARGDLQTLPDALGSTLLELRQRADDDDLVGRCTAVAHALQSLHARPGDDGRRPPPRCSAASSTNALLAGAQGALSRGDAREALDAALKARGKLAQRGHALASLEAGVLGVDAAIAAAERDALKALAAALRDESHNARSPRFALEARFAAAVAAVAVTHGTHGAHGAHGTHGALDAALLVEFAQATATSPVVARRARALLGEDVDVDDVDRIVLARLGAAAREQPATATTTTTTTTTTARPAVVARVVRSAAGPEWTVEAAAMRILLADGSVVDLSGKKVLFDLLCALCRRGGAATKEQLLQDAWGVREYHPLHHDNRLKVAVRKLRRLLEDVLGADPVEAHDDGYRMRGRVRFIA